MFFLFSLEKKRPAARDPDLFRLEKTLFPREVEDLFKGLFTDVSFGFSNEEFPSGLDRVMDLGEKDRGIGHFVNHGKGEGKIDRAVKIVDFQGVRIARSQLDPGSQPGTFGAIHEPLEHFLLEIHTDHASLVTGHFSHGKAEKSHGAPDVEDPHAGSNKRPQDSSGIVPQFPERADQDVPDPDRTDIFLHEILVS